MTAKTTDPLSEDLRSEWEWGWRAPLLLRLLPPGQTPPPVVRDFLATPLDALDFARAEPGLRDRLARLRSYRIGFRFERVQAALFGAHPGTRDLRAGIVVPGRTEIDLLHRLRDWPGGVAHWELSVKFYLALDAEGSADPDRYVGPSLHDTLGRKLHTIETRQLVALRDPEVRRAVGVAEGETVLPLRLMRGLLFAPERVPAPGAAILPSAAAPGATRGFWTTATAFARRLAERAEADPGLSIRVFADRFDWIRSARPARATPFKRYLNSEPDARIRSHFAANRDDGIPPTPLQGALYASDRSETRFFIVDDGWRGRAEATLDRMRREGRI